MQQPPQIGFRNPSPAAS